MSTLFLELKKQKVILKKNIALFIRPQRLKPLLIRVILMMYLHESRARIYQKYQQIRVGLLIQL